jgi:hypothetical protein
MRVSVLWQPTPAAVALKRPRSPSPGLNPQLPMLALPGEVWDDDLLPLLTCKEAARLESTCKALRGLVREHFKDLGRIELNELPAALMAFPSARAAILEDHRDEWGEEDHGEEWGDGENEAVLQWLQGGGWGGNLATVWFADKAACDVIHTALQAGILPSLRGVSLDLQYETARASLTGGSSEACTSCA